MDKNRGTWKTLPRQGEIDNVHYIMSLRMPLRPNSEYCIFVKKQTYQSGQCLRKVFDSISLQISEIINVYISDYTQQ
ncbi:hypothetical protein L2E82_34211 [Cichorium intybus]|uniref:Uncharacterized protein n=1 Tax=Cichorium intybus TaxID=13427 RepID=A0ACB9BM11_CICIN|nr:hypothetical protein L2E82_34211 [Cichorium intybus]